MPVQEPAAAVRVASGRSDRIILVVDDDEAFRLESCRVLRAHGYTAIPFRQGIEASWYLERHGSRAALVITDLLPPVPDGYHLGIAFDLVRPYVPVLYTSPVPFAVNVREGLLHPRAHFLRKPFPPRALLHAVRTALLDWRRRMPAA